ncbi:DUF58 domain-containing protein [Comamonadaceae bacterium OH2310_COT-174]|nr:DUF58 domain-containing protein [Comamonadaceae bacterium OH2310_COT-174]
MPAPRLLPGSLRQRLNAWIERRLPRTMHWQLSQRNLYVLPSGAGWMLGLTAALLLIAAINYQINLGFLFTFMLAGVGFVSVLVAHGNLRGLQLHCQEPPPWFAHQPARLPLVLQHPGKGTRFAIALCAQGQPEDHASMVDVPAGQPLALPLSLPPLPRGQHPCPTLNIETRYPIGAFRVWSIWRPAASLLVYPAPEPNAPALPAQHSAGQAGLASARTPSFEMEGFRSYQRGDPIKSILWKKTATALATGSGDWVRRDQTEQQASELWLDHAATGLQHPEAILSRLCAWVLAAHAQELVYGLRLPQRQIPPGQGPEHMHQCLKALALS